MSAGVEPLAKDLYWEEFASAWGKVREAWQVASTQMVRCCGKRPGLGARSLRSLVEASCARHVGVDDPGGDLSK